MFKEKRFYLFENETIYVSETITCLFNTINNTLLQPIESTEKELSDLCELYSFFTEGKTVSKQDMAVCVSKSKQSLLKLHKYYTDIEDEPKHILDEICYLLELHQCDCRFILSHSHLWILLNYYQYMENHYKYVIRGDTYCEEWDSLSHKLHVCHLCETIGNISFNDGRRIIPYSRVEILEKLFTKEAVVIPKT